MKFASSNTYTVPNSTDPIKTYEDHCLRQPKWNEQLYNKLGSNSKVLKEEVFEDRLHLEVLVQPRSEAVPVILKTVLGADAMDFVETTDYNFRTHQGTMSTKLQNSGLNGSSTRGAFSLRSESQGTVTWCTEGEVNCNLWLVGAQVERAVVNAVRQQNAQIRSYIQEHLNETSEK